MPRVKAKRQYTSTLRQAQASQTRARILDTAQRLFTQRGYAATTMEVIASEAGGATEPRKVRAEPSQRKQIAGFAADVAQIQERAVPVDDIIRSAAAVDPEIAAFRARMHGFRYDNMRQFVSWLAANGSFRGGISQDEAAAVVWTLAGPEVHRLLRTERGWSRERYAAWLADTLTRTLLA